MGAQVIAGPSNSVVIDKQGMYWMAGKVGFMSFPLFIFVFFFLIIQQWKNSGEGTLFRFLTLMCILSKINKVPPAHRIHPSGSCRRSCRPLSHPTPSTLTYHAASRGCKISLARCGGVTHWALTPDEDDSIMTVAWGQNAANGAFLPGAFALSSPYVKIL